MEILKVYEYALQREYEGKRFFEDNASRLSHAAVIDIFKRLAREEQKHIEYIQMQINALMGKNKEKETQPEFDQAGFFSSRAVSEMIDQTMAEAMVPDLPVLRMAYLIERDFAEFYGQAASKTEGEAKGVLENLAHWEKRHESLFKSLHDKAFEEYSKMPWGG